MITVTARQPDGWVDRSMLAYSAPKAGRSGVAPNVVVTTDDLSSARGSNERGRIADFAGRQVAEMKEKLPSPVIHLQQPTQVDGREAMEVLVTWAQGAVRLTQWVVFVHRSPEQAVVATATAAEREFADHRDTFAEIVYSLKL